MKKENDRKKDKSKKKAEKNKTESHSPGSRKIWERQKRPTANGEIKRKGGGHRVGGGTREQKGKHIGKG